MCGIAGILRFDNRAVSREDLSEILDSLKHRGKDNESIVIGGHTDKADATLLSEYPHVGLAHRRLSIIDLSRSADQPMSYDDRQVMDKLQW